MKTFLKTVMVSLSMLLFCGSICAQDNGHAQIPFNGKVTDVLGNPLKGVRVWIHKDLVSRSDKMGRFGLTNVLPTDTIHVRYNKKQYDIPASGYKSIRICLGDELKAEADEELADIGYGYVKRREKTIPSSGVSGEALIRTGRTDIIKALEGLVPGYQIVNGTPLIRGISSLNLSCEPLYELDGVVVSSLSTVNIYDVDHVEVLKDGSMYGSRGANGVIIVKTKRAK